VGTVLVIAALLATTAGCSLARSSRQSASDTASVSSPGVSGVYPAPTLESGSGAAVQNESKAVSPATADRLIVSNSSMNLQVDDVDKSIAQVRTIATSSGSQISGLSRQTGDGTVEPVPLGATSAGSTSQASSAQITLRVPADKLTSVENQVAKLGKVLSQSASESDVTQQHVDLAARLKNLQAEEIRLRSFLDKATKVSDMLEIERELSRVRGEIEAMQAQMSYLEQQAAMATLSISLAAPGSLVQPAGGTWGFSTAVTKGVQAAAALLGVLIVAIIALAPVWLIVLVIILIVRSRRRRRAARALAQGDSTTPVAAAEPEGSSSPPAE